MTSIFGIIRIAAVVGLSAIKVVSTCLQLKEAKEQGLISPFMHTNNSTPDYNNLSKVNNMAVNGGSMNMNHYACNEGPRWYDCTNDHIVPDMNSRRNMVSPTTMATPTMYTQPMQSNTTFAQPQQYTQYQRPQPTTSYGYGYGYTASNNNMMNCNPAPVDMTSRRYIGNPFARTQYQQPMPQQQMWGTQNRPAPQPYPTSQYRPIQPQQTWGASVYQQTPYKEQTWTNKTYGQIEQERRQYQMTHPTRKGFLPGTAWEREYQQSWRNPKYLPPQNSWRNPYYQPPQPPQPPQQPIQQMQSWGNPNYQTPQPQQPIQPIQPQWNTNAVSNMSTNTTQPQLVSNMNTNATAQQMPTVDATQSKWGIPATATTTTQPQRTVTAPTENVTHFGPGNEYRNNLIDIFGNANNTNTAATNTANIDDDFDPSKRIITFGPENEYADEVNRKIFGTSVIPTESDNQNATDTQQTEQPTQKPMCAPPNDSMANTGFHEYVENYKKTVREQLFSRKGSVVQNDQQSEMNQQLGGVNPDTQDTNMNQENGDDNQPSEINPPQDEVVPMFYTDDGTPLFGNVPG